MHFFLLLLLVLVPTAVWGQYGNPPPSDLPIPSYGPAVILPTCGHRSHDSDSSSGSHEKKRRHSKEEKKCPKCKKLSTFKGTWDTPSSQPKISYIKDDGCPRAVASCPADGKTYKFFGFTEPSSSQGFLLSRGTNLQRTLKCSSVNGWEIDSLEFGQDVAVQSLLCTTGCPTGWQLFEESCYFLGTNPLGWDAAEAACVAQDAHLASIHSQAEQDFIASLNKLGIWFGLRATTPTTKVYTDGTAVDFTHYEPLPAGVGCYGVCNDPQCPTRTWWLVKDCTTPKIYVCKKPM